MMLPKRKAGQADLQPRFFAPRRRLGFLRFAQRQFRFVADGREQRGEFAEFDFVRRKGDGGFAPRKIHLRMADARMQLEQIFQQPDARDAVDGRQMQRDLRLRFVRVIEKLFRHRRVVEKRPFRGGGRGADARAGRGIQFVKLFQPVFAQQAENRLAAETAERLAVQRERAVRARLAAMKAPSWTRASFTAATIWTNSRSCPTPAWI
jgi:hypothetical protein